MEEGFCALSCSILNFFKGNGKELTFLIVFI